MVRKEIVNTLPHPRSYRHPEFLKMVEQIHDIVAGVHLPDEQAASPSSASRGPRGPVRPVPKAASSEILGLLEVLADHGGEQDLFDIDRETAYDFGHTIAVVKSAEMLGFADTPGDLVRVTELGREMTAAGTPEKKVLFRRRLLTLGIFAALVKFLAEKPDQPRTGDEVRAFLSEQLPGQSMRDLFKTVVGWGRYGQLFDYDSRADELGLFAGRERGGGRPTL
jgi:NitT/TauT family transport system ATP-binding protein